METTSWWRGPLWLQLAVLAVSLLAWLRLLALDGDLATADPKMLRFRFFSAPARLVTHARKKILKFPTRLGLSRRPGHRQATHPRPTPA